MYKKKLISVIMPVYNGEKYLASAIESILNQTYDYFELIIINDGSTDNSMDIINNYAKMDNRILVVSRKNRGLVYTLNEAIKISTGEYIARMDADDISHTLRFEKQVYLLNDNPNLYLVGTDFELIFEENVSEDLKQEMIKFQEFSNKPIPQQRRFDSLLEGYRILHPTWMIRKELFANIGYYKNYNSEDGEFLFRTTVCGYDMDKVNETLFSYRIHNKSKGAIDRRENLYKKDAINYKLDYLENILDDFNESSYFIWGADVSGSLAYTIISERYGKSKLLSYIDSIKSGDFNGKSIIKPEQIFQYDYDYIFICTRGGAKYAVDFLSEQGLKNIDNFFKIV